MNPKSNNLIIEASKARNAFEWLLILVFMSALALKMSYSESLIYNITLFEDFSNIVYSLRLSNILLLTSLTWLFYMFLRRQSVFAKNQLMIPAFAFITLACIFIIFASNKRSAINYTITLSSTIIAGLVLFQLINSPLRIKFVFALLIGLACMNAIECVNQYTTSNQMVISDYESDPAKHLANLNIEKDSLEYWQYKHRLYSKDIRGFLATSNSVSTFFILAISIITAGTTALTAKDKTHVKFKNLIIPLSGLVLILAAFFLAYSKGAIIASLITLILLTAFMLLRKKILNHKYIFISVASVLIITAVSITVYFGSTYGKLPGGNSMRFRWQYWSASWEIFKENPIFGVGGNNFATAYLKHKLPQALETINDPHNFILSILCQFGPFALIAFLILIIKPLLASLFADSDENKLLSQNIENPKTLYLSASIVALVLFIFRIPLANIPPSNDPLVASYILFTVYFIPAFVFILAFCLSVKHLNLSKNNNTFRIILTFGIISILIHNTIDFAIFDSGNLLAILAVLACIINLTHNKKLKQPQLIKVSGKVLKTTILCAAALIYSVVCYSEIKVEISNNQIKEAFESPFFNESKLNSAVMSDSINPYTAIIQGDIFYDKYLQERSSLNDLEKAQQSYNLASTRDPLRYNSFTKSAKTSFIFAQISSAENRVYHLNTAKKNLLHSLELYPYKSQNWIELASVYEKLNENKEALKCYEKAVELEQQFQKEFKILYPVTHETIYRMGKDDFMDAVKKIEKLSTQIRSQNPK